MPDLGDCEAVRAQLVRKTILFDERQSRWTGDKNVEEDMAIGGQVVALQGGAEERRYDVRYSLTLSSPAGQLPVILTSPPVRFTPTRCSAFRLRFDEDRSEDSFSVRQVGALEVLYFTVLVQYLLTATVSLPSLYYTVNTSSCTDILYVQNILVTALISKICTIEVIKNCLVRSIGCSRNSQSDMGSRRNEQESH